MSPPEPGPRAVSHRAGAGGGAGSAGPAALEERLARAHPQVGPLLEGGDEPPPDDVETARADYRALNEARTGPREPVARCLDLEAGGVPVRVYMPALEEGDAPETRGSEGGGLDQGAAALDPPVATAAQPAILFLHGGGWVVGDLDGVDALCRALANRTGAVVVSADYRLAPEHPFPAALDDAWAVLSWLHGHAHELGADPDRLAVAGESAGANLAAAAARRAHADPDDPRPRLRAQLLAYPALDGALAAASYDELGSGFGLTREQMRWYWDAYAPGRAARAPEASPLRAPDLAGLPPALIVQAELDPLLDDGLDYAQRLRDAGVDADVHVWPGMVHGFLRYRGLLDDAHAALDEAAARLAALLA
ncbi:MAG: alpha/beta hydrolase [Solirubrobacteraceae bacterium MAG38_C4-C5]|nr:alpha/beta hydrolase [Candidatus Siliceabacter maunaloa]